MDKPQTIEIKAYTKSELAALYKVSLKVFRSWITPHKRKIGEYLGKTYTPAQVKIITDCLGEWGE